jgi:hypothetical protein
MDEASRHNFVDLEIPVVFLPSFIITHTYHPLYGRP